VKKENKEKHGNSMQILGVNVTSDSEDRLLKRLVDFMAQPQAKNKSLLVFTPNPEFLVAASRDGQFRQTLNKADINLPDGAGLVFLSKFFGWGIKKRVSGADLVASLLEIGNQKEWLVGVVGARRGENNESNLLIARLQKRYPNIKFINLDNYQTSRVNSSFDLVFACHGMGKQEEWILGSREEVKAKVFMGVGGALDFLTGFAKRAPFWMRNLGLEWFWRGIQRQGHFKRIWRAVFVFPWLAVKERLKG